MKADERKALERNVLAQELGKVVEGIKKGPSRSTMFWIGLGITVIVVVVLFRYFLRSSEATASQRWLKLDEVVFPEQLTAFLAEKELEDSPQGRFARFKLARVKLAEGLRDLGTNPERARENVEVGTRLYEELLKTAGRVPVLHQEALGGAAKGNETLGDLDQARTYYKRLVDEYPSSALGKEAKKQLDWLDSDAGKKDISELLKALSPPNK